jgi:hypothetical protein
VQTKSFSALSTPGLYLQGILLGSSKKDIEQKRVELLQASFGQALAEECVRQLPQLLRGPPAADIVAEIVCGGEAGVGHTHEHSCQILDLESRSGRKSTLQLG